MHLRRFEVKPRIGRTVIYTLADYDLDDGHAGYAAGKQRPAVIVEDWGNGKHDAHEMSSAVNLQVFTDGSNDGLPPVFWKTSVLFSASPRPGCWSWPVRMDEKPISGEAI